MTALEAVGLTSSLEFTKDMERLNVLRLIAYGEMQQAFNEEELANLKTKSLQVLNLYYAPNIASLDPLPNKNMLRQLLLYGTAMDDDSLGSFAECTQLEELYIDSPNITIEGVRHLITLNGLKKLVLNKMSQIRPDDVEALSAKSKVEIVCAN